MENQLTNNANALRLFFTDEVFAVEDKTVKMPHSAITEAVLPDTIVEHKKPDPSLSTPSTAHIPTAISEEKLKNYTSEAESIPIVAEPTASVEFKFLGGNKKSVLILVNDKDNDVSTPEGRELLRKIVKAVDLATADFALVNYANYTGSDFIALQQFFKPVIMLSFGVEISHLKLNLTWQNEIILHANTKIIFAPNLHQLDSDIAAKKLLWGNLQKIK
ncbi:hypothetical protein [Pedobacter frigidisoli]|uniref:hypothetical protein n=1 Tax=Pedobacter frigidisoli TaxID=2530455 RepID=UPI00292DBAF1|nr:hypothetical protein [Pedobacter frigidisoli]